MLGIPKLLIVAGQLLGMLVLLVQQQADAHAVMIQPRSRPWYDYLERYNYNPHAVFAGGKTPILVPELEDAECFECSLPQLLLCAQAYD